MKVWWYFFVSVILAILALSLLQIGAGNYYENILAGEWVVVTLGCLIITSVVSLILLIIALCYFLKGLDLRGEERKKRGR